ncbi:alpha-amylase family glycosyl hydrolase [Salsipaludibacter albus]|uniref:alpha-amylase family glycosyl hydrolase n=1 Tax=Salsipaludibacter albus TaxID=2849650 RepID=UPI001EE3B258|nr:hypothetical protein [Salsipaludibacter albus]
MHQTQDAPATAPAPHSPRRWYDDTVGYQVYVRSFADTTGNGIGDLPGVLAHVDHIADLGVDFVWLNPVYPSPGFDHGYDVADYRDIADDMGGMAAFEELRDALHARGVRMLMDIVPGHTSHTHAWFRSARQGRDAPYRDFYVWRDPAPDGGPPNNWESVFGGPAWEFDDHSGQYYMHRFLPEQPDLDWRNPAVRDAFDDILRFWFERGVDGFRVDVAQGMLADPDWTDIPEIDPDLPPDEAADLRFSGYMGRPETPELYERWRRIADSYDALLLGEVYLSDPDVVATYITDDRLHRAFFLPLQHTTWDRDQVATRLRRAVEVAQGRFAWPQSSHDDPRAGSRFGGGDRGRRRAMAFFHLVGALPGTPVMLAGDELGLDDGQVARLDAEDPITTRNADREDGRDGSRTPMPWDPDLPNLGFSEVEPWLPLGSNRGADDTVTVQEGDPDSPLHRMRRFLAARRGLVGMLATDEVAWLDLGDDVLALRRGDVVVACNFGSATHLDLPGTGRLAVASSDDAAVTGTDLALGRDTTALVVLEEDA